MDGMRVLHYLILYLVPVLERVKTTSAEYCHYSTQFGVEFTYCPEQCCPGQVRNKYEACCEFTHSNGVYIGASLGTMILVGMIFLCLTYLCCKQRMMQRVRERERSNSNTRTRQHRSHRSRRHQENTVPSISLSVEPIQPPPYETLDLPPPYFPVAGPADDKTTENKAYLDQPPPAYSQNVDDNDT